MRAANETNLERVLHNLTPHPPKTPDVGECMDEVRWSARMFAEALCENCPSSRELSMALTALEDSCMYAIAAIARNQGD